MSRYAAISDELAGAPRRWLVTGAAGFIGSAIVERLLELGQQVVGLDNFATGHQRNLDEVTAGAGAGAGRFRFVEADICDLDACRVASEGIDFVLHQAALGSVPRSIEDPLATHRANVDGFMNVLLAARDAGVKRMVFASSSSVYGDDPTLPKVEAQIGRCLSPYAVSKYVDELYAHIAQDCYGFELIGLRYFNVFGRRQDPEGPYAAVIPRWIDRLVAGQPCEVFGDGSASRDFCYVDDAVQANLLAATGDPAATNQIYNVAYGDRTDLDELFAILRDRIAIVVPEAAGAEPLYLDPRPGDIAHSQASIEKIAAALGYEPLHDIRSGLAETVDWFLRR